MWCIRVGWVKYSLILTLISGLALASCTRRSALSTGERHQTLFINIRIEPPSLDWTKAGDDVSSSIIWNIMEGLVSFDFNRHHFRAVPALAESWDTKAQSRQFVFHLKKGVRWNDGVELKAQHFIDAWERLLDPQTGAQYTYLYPIKNARAFSEKKVPFSAVGAKATDDHTLVIDLERPMGYFPLLLVHNRTWPIRKDIIGKEGNQWASSGKMVTLGAYRVAHWEHGKDILLERNETYYGEKAKIKYVRASMVEESSTALNEFDSGQLDVVWKLPSGDLPRLRLRPEFHEVPQLAIYYYGFNLQKKPVSNPIFRRALAMSIDRDEIVKVLAGGQRVTSSFIPEGIFGYESNRGMRYDPLEAKELLKRSGYRDLTKIPNLELLISTADMDRRVAENVQAQLKRNLGLTVEIQSMEWKMYLDTLKQNPPAVYRMAWSADYPDPDNFLSIFKSYSENNSSRWKHREYDDIVEKSAVETNEEERQKDYAKAQHILVEEEIPIIPLFMYTEQYLINQRVGDFPLNGLHKIPLKAVFLK